MKSTLTYRVNAYVAILIVTIFGAGASLLIIHAANRASDLAAVQSTYP